MNGVEFARFKKELRQQPCANCGRLPGDPDVANRIEADHVFPLARYGELPDLRPSDLDAPENLQPLCGPCNRYKSTWTHEELRARRFVEWREPIDWRVASGSPVRGDLVEWPRGFDWATGEWVDRALSDDDHNRWLDLVHAGSSHEAWTFFEQAPRVERRTPADWVRGLLFDYPVRPASSEPKS